MKSPRALLAFALLAASSVAIGSPAPGPSGLPAAQSDLDRLFRYIQDGWTNLERSIDDGARAAADPKTRASSKDRAIIYLPPDENPSLVRARLRRRLKPGEIALLDLRVLASTSSAPAQPGLLYLPHPYVVPGGRFNEMYGWDSYFIILGLLRDGKIDLARDMADDLLYEISHYGKILNANRSYYLTRSQPPFLTESVLAVYRRTRDKTWLQGALPAITAYYRYWTVPPHLTPETGLSRYFDEGLGQAPEVVQGERDGQGRDSYERIRGFWRAHPAEFAAAGGPLYYDTRHDSLTALFYENDRAMRESGFDPTARFGPFGTRTAQIDPVCLNALLYRMERETALILRTLGDPQGASAWDRKAERRRERIDRFLWDGKAGLYFDYDFKTKHRDEYLFASAYYPLWAGAADQRQASQVARKSLKILLKPGGLLASPQETGEQWDAPFGWAPLELIASEGLRRYGFNEEADRLSERFASLVLREFRRSGAVFEKYDVASPGSRAAPVPRFGYGENVVGFGWTNAVFEALYDELPPSKRPRILAAARD